MEKIERDLRCIITQKCNYGCTFCHKEGCEGNEKNKLNPEDYGFLYETAKQSIHISGTTLTGGEPFLRKDLDRILAETKKYGSKNTIVSNGSLLHKNGHLGIFTDKINISLHHTQDEIYQNITQSNYSVKQILDNIAYIKGIYPHLNIKINSTVLKEENKRQEEVLKKNKIAENLGIDIKYIEVFGEEYKKDKVSIEEIENFLLANNFALWKENTRNKTYKNGNLNISLGKVFCAKALETDNPEVYCKNNNDIYITPDGYASVCPMNAKKFSLLQACKERNTNELREVFHNIIDQKTSYNCPFISYT